MDNFDWKIYRELNPDLVAAHLNTENKIIDHWNIHGQKEKRIHKIQDITPDFEWQQYAALNQDLQASGVKTKTDVELHWIRHGINEKRKYKIKEITADFDWQQYANLNLDLEKNGIITKTDIEVHWIKYGMKEKRKYKIDDVFIIKNYKESYLKNYIMQSLHEEIININGVIDSFFITNDNLVEYFQKKYNRIPQGILFLWCFTRDLYNKIRSQLPNTKIILWTDDLHWYSREQYENNYFCFKNADIHLAHYNYFKMFYNIDVNNLVRLHHSCGNNFYKNDVNLSSINKIYMYGSVDNVHYKLRTSFLNSMKSQYPDKIIYKSHPGYDGDRHNDSIITANELYKYTFCFTSGAFPKFDITETSSTPYYLLGKIFEIPGSGVLLLCNDYNIKDELNELGFYDMINYVSIDDNNFNKTIEWLFNPTNKDKIIEIRNNGHKLIQEKHHIIKRIENINNILSNTINLL